jgi:Cu+-exporting ATPase
MGSRHFIAGALAVADSLKPDAPAVVKQLTQLGMKVWMISGDNERTAAHIAAQAGIDLMYVVAGVKPAGKLAKVQELRDAGAKIAFVGDGINDAPALVAADLGMAMAQADTGTDVAMHAAGLTLMRGELRLVGQALDVCRLTVQKIRQNLFWAFVFNAAGIPLAASGWLTPVLAGMAMSMSSLSVMLNALLLRRHRAPH